MHASTLKACGVTAKDIVTLDGHKLYLEKPERSVEADFPLAGIGLRSAVSVEAEKLMLLSDEAVLVDAPGNALVFSFGENGRKATVRIPVINAICPSGVAIPLEAADITGAVKAIQRCDALPRLNVDGYKTPIFVAPGGVYTISGVANKECGLVMPAETGIAEPIAISDNALPLVSIAENGRLFYLDGKVYAESADGAIKAVAPITESPLSGLWSTMEALDLYPSEVSPDEIGELVNLVMAFSEEVTSQRRKTKPALFRPDGEVIAPNVTYRMSATWEGEFCVDISRLAPGRITHFGTVKPSFATAHGYLPVVARYSDGSFLWIAQMLWRPERNGGKQ